MISKMSKTLSNQNVDCQHVGMCSDRDRGDHIVKFTAAADFIEERERVCSDKYSVNGKEFIHNKQLRRRCGNGEWRQ